jgi:hypothetical protein
VLGTRARHAIGEVDTSAPSEVLAAHGTFAKPK